MEGVGGGGGFKSRDPLKLHRALDQNNSICSLMLWLFESDFHLHHLCSFRSRKLASYEGNWFLKSGTPCWIMLDGMDPLIGDFYGHMICKS